MKIVNNQPVSTTSVAVTLWNAGDRKAALKLFSGFRLGLTKDQSRILQMAYEIETGKGKFYEMIGENLDEVKAKAEEVVNSIWLNQ